MENIVDIVIKAIGDFMGDALHDWTDITIFATPDFGQAVGITVLAVISSFFILLMMEADSNG